MRKFLIIGSLVFNLFGVAQNSDRYIFFLHNAFLEQHSLNDLHPQYGRAAYTEILDAFKEQGFQVISEKRKGNVDIRNYAHKVLKQIDSLISLGTDPSKITVVGTSKGGYIAQYVSTYAHNPNLNFVFIGSFRNSNLKNLPDINFCGNILNIYEESDPNGVSAIKRKEMSTCNIKYFKEIELHTGLKHGFLFKPLKLWIDPTIKWAEGNYELN